MTNKLYCALGYACNSNCRICVVDSQTCKTNNLSTNEVINFFEKIDLTNIQEVSLSGGEPTIRADLPKILNYAKARFPRTTFTIFSNGIRFSDINYARTLANSNVKNVIIVLHGHTPALHDWQTRTRGSFKKTTQGIQNLLDLGLKVTLKIIPTKRNYMQIPQIVEYILKKFPACRHMTFNGLDIRGQAFQNKDDVAISFSDASAFIELGIEKAVCSGLKTSTFSIPMCTLAERYRKYAGDQRETLTAYIDPLQEVLNKREEEHGITEKCAPCAHHSTCSGAWTSYFDAMGLDDIKPIMKKNAKIVIEVNGSCNNNCMICAIGGSHPSLDAKKEVMLQKIMSFKLKEGSVIILSGGEPTLQDGIIDIIRQLKENKYEVQMISNGRNFSNMKFSKKIADTGLTSAVIEIHSHIPEIHDFITGRPGSFKETMEGLRNLQLCGVRITINIILNRVNCKTLPQTVEFACNSIPQATNISITALNLRGRALANKSLFSIRFSDAAQYVEKCIDVATRMNKYITLDAFPICALRPKYRRQLISMTQNSSYEAERCHDKEKCWALKCLTCSCATECSGIWKSHIDEFGEDKL